MCARVCVFVRALAPDMKGQSSAGEELSGQRSLGKQPSEQNPVSFFNGGGGWGLESKETRRSGLTLFHTAAGLAGFFIFVSYKRTNPGINSSSAALRRFRLACRLRG